MYRTLFKIFGIAALVCAVLYYFLENEVFASFFALLMGCTLIMLAQSGMQRGKFRMRRRHAVRSVNPVLFWSFYMMYSSVGAVLAVYYLMVLLGIL